MAIRSYSTSATAGIVPDGSLRADFYRLSSIVVYGGEGTELLLL